VLRKPPRETDKQRLPVPRIKPPRAPIGPSLLLDVTQGSGAPF
jgi:hypothetical protein